MTMLAAMVTSPPPSSARPAVLDDAITIAVPN